MNLIKPFLISLINHGYAVGFKNLNDIEKLFLLIQIDFSIRNEFYGKNDSELKVIEWFNDYFTEDFQLSKHGNSSFSARLMNNFKKENLPLVFKKYLSCYVCSKFLCIEKNTDINYIECEFGHKIRRCVKSFLPLNIKKYKKCKLCEAEWNLFSELEIPNFLNFFSNVEKLCVFCDCI